jgi:hypothetical protein
MSKKQRIPEREIQQKYYFRNGGVYVRKAVILPSKEFYHYTESQTLDFLINNTKDLIKALDGEKKRLEEKRASINQGSIKFD